MATCLKNGGVVSNPSIQEWIITDEAELNAIKLVAGPGTTAHTAGYATEWELAEDNDTWAIIRKTVVVYDSTPS